jgi:hypothetical protein
VVLTVPSFRATITRDIWDPNPTKSQFQVDNKRDRGVHQMSIEEILFRSALLDGMSDFPVIRKGFRSWARHNNERKRFQNLN